ncbi:uncharacterized protein LOC144886912 [Branchiostoma floridae x Branchiostoma japonicum]
METGGRGVLGGHACLGQGGRYAPDAGVGAPTPRSVPGLCQISGVDERQYKGLVVLLWQTVLQMERAHKEHIIKLCQRFNESIVILQERFVRSCTFRVGGRTVRSPQTHRCVLCHKLGHWKGTCYLNVGNVNKSRPSRVSRIRPSPKTHPCFVCRRFGHWKAHCPLRNRNGNRSNVVDDQVNCPGNMKEIHKSVSGVSEVDTCNAESKHVHCEDKEKARDSVPSRRDGLHVLTPGTRVKRQTVRRPGGLVPPCVVVPGDGSTTDSDDDEVDSVEYAGQPTDAKTVGGGEDPQALEQAGGAVQPSAVGGHDVAQQVVPAQAEGDPKDGATGVPAQSESEAPVRTEDGTAGDHVKSGSEKPDGETVQPAEHASPGDALDSDDDEDGAPALRRSTRTRHPPDRYGLYVNTVNSCPSPNNMSVRDVHPAKVLSIVDQSSIVKATQRSGNLEKCPDMAEQVTLPSTQGQRGICQEKKASDTSVRSPLGSIIRSFRNLFK